MKTRITALLFVIGLISTAAVAQSVTMANKRVTYTRKKPIQDFKKTFTINYPKIRAATPSISRKIEAILSYEKVFNFTLKEEMGEIQWLENADYSVEYNANGLLAIDLSIEGSGAYPDGVTKSITVDIRKGTRLTPAAAFKNLAALAALVKGAQRKEINDAIVEIRKDPEFSDPDPRSLFESADFKVKDLDWFAVSETGVVFKYDYGFPHVIQALQPPGEFFYTWEQLKPYIRAGSLLSRVAS